MPSVGGPKLFATAWEVMHERLTRLVSVLRLWRCSEVVLLPSSLERAGDGHIEDILIWDSGLQVHHMCGESVSRVEAFTYCPTRRVMRIASSYSSSMTRLLTPLGCQ